MIEPGDAEAPIARQLTELVGINGARWAGGRANCEVHPMAGEQAPSSFALTTAVDILLVRAAWTTVAAREEMNGTAELGVTYLRPAEGIARVDARVVGRAPRLRVLEFTVSDDRGDFAFGRSTYVVRAVRGG